MLSNLEYWMAHSIKPLIKEPIHRLSGRFLDRNAKLFSLDRLVRILLQVIIDGAPPILFSQTLAKHVQDCSASRIRICVKDCIRVSIILSNDWAANTLFPGCKIRILICFNIGVEKIISSEFVFIPHRLEVGRETFIQPYV